MLKNIIPRNVSFLLRQCLSSRYLVSKPSSGFRKTFGTKVLPVPANFSTTTDLIVKHKGSSDLYKLNKKYTSYQSIYPLRQGVILVLKETDIITTIKHLN